MMKSHNGGANYSVTILTTPTLIRAGDVEPRNSLVLANISNSTVYLGYDSNLTVDNGFPFIPQERTSEEYYHGAVYGVVATGTAELRVRTY